jgi:hypothetical protein
MTKLKNRVTLRRVIVEYLFPSTELPSYRYATLRYCSIKGNRYLFPPTSPQFKNRVSPPISSGNRAKERNYVYLSFHEGMKSDMVSIVNRIGHRDYFVVFFFIRSVTEFDM